MEKAAEGRRSPKPGGNANVPENRASVLECAGPPALFAPSLLASRRLPFDARGLLASAATARSFIPQRVNWIETRSFAGGVEAEEYTDGGADEKRSGDPQ